MMNKYQLLCLLSALPCLNALPCLAQEVSVQEAPVAPPVSAPEVQPDNGNTALIRIEHFRVEGNTLLDAGLIERLLAPHTGDARSYTDIQLALEDLEGAYRSAGYSAVHVSTPEQEIADGTVTLQVTETIIGKVVVKDNRHYDKVNIRNALPALHEGRTPSARELSENIRLANENPTRHLDVVLAVGDADNTVDAEVNVQDSSPHKVFVTLDNTGNQSTGKYRAGVGYQHNNLFNRDQAATFNYITSPDHINSVTQLSASYRMPLYTVGDSIDLIAARSDTNAGTTAIVGGSLAFSGKGNVFGAHYNHYLARQGDYTSKIIAGLDYRAYFNNCSLNLTGMAATGCGASGNDLTVHPVSLTYAGTLSRPAFVSDFAAAIVQNVPGGQRGGSADFNAYRPSASGIGRAPADYTIFRSNGSLTGILPQDWQYRIAGNMQYTRDALVAYEGLSLVGANAVRGFAESEVRNDKGYFINLEFYTPELASHLHLQNSSLRFLGFIDHARGWKVPLPGEQMVRDSVGSAGLGLRCSWDKNTTIKFDWARVLDAGGSSRAGDSRGQISMMASW